MFNKTMKTFEWHDDTPENNMTVKSGYFIEETGKFLIIPDRSWEERIFTGDKYKSLIIMGNNNAALVIGFNIIVFNEGLNVFVDRVIEQFGNIEGYTLTQRSEFVTLRNVKGERVKLNIV